MAKTKISEFSSTPANNTDIDSINIAEGCAPSNINDAIRELMAQLKDFQTGAVGDSFNGPIGSSTAAAGAFTTLSATGAITSTLATGTAPLVIASTTKVANLNVDLLDGADWASPAALGSTTPAAVSATTLSASGAVTLSGGTANGVTYLNGSKVLTSGSALTFNGTLFDVDGSARSNNWIGRANSSAPTADAFIYRPADNSLGFGTANTEGLRLTSTSLYTASGINVGIGTSLPASKFDLEMAASTNGGMTVGVNNSMVGTIGTGGFSVNGGAITDFGIRANANLLFATGSGAPLRMTIDSAGNLGLGTAPSAWGSGLKAIQIGPQSSLNSGDTAFTAATRLSTNTYSEASSVFKRIDSGFATSYYQQSGAHYWETAGSSTAGSTISFSQAMTLDASGQLGIGSTSPTQVLTIAQGGNFPFIHWNNSSNTNIAFAGWHGGIGGDDDFRIGTTGAKAFTFRTNNTERARIDSSGSLLVGTTTPDSGVQLKVVGGIIKCLDVYNNTTSSAANVQIDSNGNFARSTSSLKYKTDVQNATHGLAQVIALRPVTYKGKHDGDTVFGGLIAEEVHAVGLTEFVQYAPDGTPDALAYGNMVSLAFKAIQEQQAIIESLKARLDAANL